ncbi:Alcohol dehydrogenase [Bythopirellula goksoeyrii]|uniref:Alcohol dehydrogenase n=2 Tax=Bythopirellula goksoeyrii TaxID=1400387 RepID=A0A5B9QDN2_9BACT|nr:Alcohol dehydrogenase [Bythopirellula goksoeyrii]
MSHKMRAMVLRRIAPLGFHAAPLEYTEIPIPEARPNEVLIKVSTCGVCHTELDEIEGRTAPPQFPIVLGHEVVGSITNRGSLATKFNLGDRVGVGWIHSSSGAEDENLSERFCATGRDVNGGYADYMTAPEDYVYPIPPDFTDEQAAPLLCAGAIGYRALKLTKIVNGERLGLTGFGGSAHLVLQLVRHVYPESPVYVFARDADQRDLAISLGAAWTGDTADRSPESLHAIIDTTPAWKPVVESLANLLPGGRLVINAIRKQEDDKDALLNLSYHQHLWMERGLKSVANITRHDISEFLPLAAEAGLRPVTQTYTLEDANQAILDLKFGRVRGAKVLSVN